MKLSQQGEEVMTLKRLKTIGIAAVAGIIGTVSVFAGPITDRIAADKTIRIGFANIPIWAYPGKNEKPEGFVNEIVLGTLKKMGYTKIEPVVTDWSGLIPGLKANRYDLITGGMYILKSRCENISFAEPFGNFGDAMLVPKGNPKNINNYKDVLKLGGTLVTGAGYNTVEAAKKEGLKDDNIMQVPGPAEILAAVQAGRADAGILTYFEAKDMAGKSKGSVEVTDPAALPKWTKNYAAVGFRGADADFMAKFNIAQAAYLGSDEMMAAVTPFGYTKSHLPGDVTTKWACENR